MSDDQLRSRAAAAGILTSYRTARGEVIDASADALSGVLDALGEFRADELATVVAWDGELPALPGGAWVHVDGPRTEGTVPLGYHPVFRGNDLVGTVVAAPRLTPAAPRGRWGVFAPLFAVREHADSPMATYTQLGQLFEWLDRAGGDTLLTLPLLPLFLDEPADWSPYAPVTRLMWNELYVDLDEYGFGPGDDAPRPRDRLLDYPAIAAEQTTRLDSVAALDGHDVELDAFVAENPLAQTYAAFRAAQAVHGRNWRAWPTETACPDGDPVVEQRHLIGQMLADRQLSAIAARAAERGQWLALDIALGTHADGFDTWLHRTLFVDSASVGAPPDEVFRGGQDWGFPPVHPQRSRLFGHRYFAETLRHHLRFAKLLRLDHVMGLARQWWVPHGLKATDGAYVTFPLEELFAVVCLEAAQAGAVIVGENLGIVPPEITNGLAEHRMLGIHVVTDHLPSFGTGDVERSTEHDVVMVSTHDGVPFASWWKGGDITRAREQGLLSDEAAAADLAEREQVRQRVTDQLVADGRLHEPGNVGATMVAVVEETASQPAPVAIFNLEDFWLEDQPQNTPGTWQEVPNWRRTFALSLDELNADPGIAETCRRIRTAR